jgi:hypothetical protein
VLPTRAAALDFMPVHVRGFVEKANAAFDASRSTLTGVSSSLSQSSLVIANYLCLSHDILAVLVLWLATTIRDADVSDDRPIDIIINTLVVEILEKFNMLSSGVHFAAFWHPSAAIVEELFSSVIRVDNGALFLLPNTPSASLDSGTSGHSNGYYDARLANAAFPLIYSSRELRRRGASPVAWRTASLSLALGDALFVGGENHLFGPTNCLRVTLPQAESMKVLNRQRRVLLRPMRQADC